MKNTHIVRCITKKDPYLTFGKLYECWLDGDIDEDDVLFDACGITDDDGDKNYFMFPHEYEIVSRIDDV